jgi:RES domain-containing protein
VIYTAGTYAGALLEILAHAQRPMLHVPYHCLVLDVPADVPISVLSPGDVPGWDAGDYVASRAAGDAWLDAQRSALLQVPALTGYPFEVHVLINPLHGDAPRLQQIGPYPVRWDERLTIG